MRSLGEVSDQLTAGRRGVQAVLGRRVPVMGVAAAWTLQ